MACCLMPPSHYPTQCWLLINMLPCHTGKPNSPFSAKHHPFQAQTTRSPHTIPVLGFILPFTAQSHPPVFGIFDGSPTCAACYKMQLQSWAPVRVWRDLPNRIISQVQKWPWFIIKIKIFNYMHILSGSYLNFQRFRRIRLWFCYVNFSISRAKYRTPGHP